MLGIGIWEGERVPLLGASIHRVRLGAGPPVLLLHGFGGWTFSWRKTLPALLDHWEAHAIDLRGFGLSEKPLADVYDTEAQAALVAAYIERYIGRPAALIGHSLGGLIALATAIRFPERVQALVLVAAAGRRLPLPPRWVVRLLALPLLGGALMRLCVSSPRALRRLLALVYADPGRITPETVQGYARPLRARRAHRVLARMLNSRLVPRLDLAAVRVPTLIIWGERDRVIPPAVGKTYAAAIRGARLVTLPEIGHAPAEEAPDRFNAILKEFLGDTVGRRA